MTLREKANIELAAPLQCEFQQTSAELWACGPRGPKSEVAANALVVWLRQQGCPAQVIQVEQDLWTVLALAPKDPHEQTEAER